VPQIVRHVARRAVAIGGPLGQRLLADPLELAGNGVVDLPGGALVGARDRVHQLPRRLPPEWPAAGQQFIEHDSQAEHIRPPVDAVRLAAYLFGAHVGRRASDPRPLAVVFIRERQTKVGDTRPVRLIDQDVGRLDVAVHQTAHMGVVERLGHGRDQLGDVAKRHARVPQTLGEVAALDVLRHHEAEAVVRAAHVVDGDDVRVFEPRQRAGLGQVLLDVMRSRDPLPVRHLDRHRAVQLVVVRQVDTAEPALAQAPDHAVAADRGRVGRFILLRVPGQDRSLLGRVRDRGRPFVDRAAGMRSGRTVHGRRAQGAGNIAGRRPRAALSQGAGRVASGGAQAWRGDSAG
jgi:hypothetical protein